MDNWDDDSNDWDGKVKEIKEKTERKAARVAAAGSSQAASHLQAGLFEDDDGNYHAQLEIKKAGGQARTGLKAPKAKLDETYRQPLSSKKLQHLRDFIKSPESSQKLFQETFGDLETFLATHAEPDLSGEKLVDLLIIDAALLELPIDFHNKMLLQELSKIGSFWNQIIRFTETFLEKKKTDVSFLIAVDMNGFFDNIESMMNNLLLNNLYNDEMQQVFKKLIEATAKFEGNVWSNTERLRMQDECSRDLIDSSETAVSFLSFKELFESSLSFRESF